MWGKPTLPTHGCLPVVVGPDDSRPIDVTTTEGRLPRQHSHQSPHLHSFLHLTLFTPVAPKTSVTGATYLLTWSHSSTPHGLPSLAPPPPPLPSVPLFSHPKKECLLWLSVGLLLNLFSLLVRAGIEQHLGPKPVLSLRQLCVRWLGGFFMHGVQVATYGANAAAPEFIPQQTTGDWPSTTAPNENEKCLFSNTQGFLHNILVTCFNK